MNILVVGNGGREHTLCWKIAQSPKADKIYCAPGNAGTAEIAENIDIDVEKLDELANFAEKNNIGVTIVGPEAPLCNGIVDVFKKRNLKVFGPDKFSSQLEGSKCFSKEFMTRNNIPTAKAEYFTDKLNAIKYIENEMPTDGKIVIKADGLAAGKGVIIADSKNQAIEAAMSCFEGAFGDSGSKVLIEEYLEGEEASILAFTDGNIIIPLVASQDHKRVGEGDTGLNTGGMGAYCPAPVITSTLKNEIQEKVLNNFLNGVKQEKLYYHGIIYAGIMVTKEGPKVLEFNVRFGDPEVQAVMALMDCDLLDIILKTIEGKLETADIKWKQGVSVCVVMASGGYPGNYEKGFEIKGIKEAEKTGAIVFHAGTSLKNDKVVNSGGRVLGVTAVGSDINKALTKVYSAIDKIKWKNSFYRRDIAHKAINRI